MRDDEFLPRYGGVALISERGKIRDKAGRLLGYSTTWGNSIEIRDEISRLIGYVEKETIYIRDVIGRMLGYVTKSK